MTVVNRQLVSARKQIGTLGGGNHFIELQRCNDGYLWIMLHSGSRNLGKMVGDYYNVMGLPVCRLGQVLRKIAPEIMEDTQ